MKIDNSGELTGFRPEGLQTAGNGRHWCLHPPLESLHTSATAHTDTRAALRACVRAEAEDGVGGWEGGVTRARRRASRPPARPE